MRLLLVTLTSYFTLGISADEIDRYVIACHTTDFECFRRQYRSLRDQLLMGNKLLGVTPYEPYIFRYGSSGTCIRLSGIEHSELTNLRIDSISREFTWTLEMPFKVQQVLNTTSKCVEPDIDFPDVSMDGTLKKFTGNSTMQVIYPFVLKAKDGVTYMLFGDENLDVILDIPDLSHYKNESQFERNLYELSEWAYSVVKNVDAAQHFALPFTSRFRSVASRLPMQRLLLLYPDEKLSTLQFKLNSSSKCY